MINTLALRQASPELVQLYRRINWLPFENLLSASRKVPEHEQAWPQLILFRMLLLDCWDGHHQPRPDNRCRFFGLHRFVGLGKTDSLPDQATLRRFQYRLESEGLLRLLLAELNRQITAKKLAIGPARDIHCGISVIPSGRSRTVLCHGRTDGPKNRNVRNIREVARLTGTAISPRLHLVEALP